MTASQLLSRSHGGTELGGLTPPGLAEQGIRYHVAPCWVLVGGAGLVELVTAREWVGHQAVRVALCISLFVLYILLISIVVVTVRFVCCFC